MRTASRRFTSPRASRFARATLLIELDNTEARADLAAAEAAASDSRSQYKRSQELFQTKALSEAQLDQLQATLLANEARVAAARSRLADRVITAPFNGRVGLRNVSLGGLVNPGAVITTLDDLSVVKLDFSVPEQFLSTLQPGLTVQARSTAYPDSTFDGRVASVDTRVDPTTRSVAIRALIDNRDSRLRPGMFMTVQAGAPGRPGTDAAGAGDRAGERAALRVRRGGRQGARSARSRSAGAGPAKSKSCRA